MTTGRSGTAGVASQEKQQEKTHSTVPNGTAHKGVDGAVDGADMTGATRSQHRVPAICWTLRRKLSAFLEEDTAESKLLNGVQRQVRASMAVIEEALQRYEYGQLSLSYNGGKDCLVLLILILACLPTLADPATEQEDQPAQKNHTSTETSTSTNSNYDARTDDDTQAKPKYNNFVSSSSSSNPPPAYAPFQAIYIVPHDPFPEVDAFVEDSAAEYHLDLARYPVPMRAALEAYLGERPAVQAIFLGTRRTDPHGEFLTAFTPTDAGWPQFMRVHPVLDWHYAEIWAFIRHLEIPFCSLYNKGFTSLGGTSDTRPNPALAVKGDGFRPAYELMADDEERLGRDH